jgi:molybdopterin synthase catalytic subunit
MSDREITVLLFAALRDLVGDGEIRIDLPEGSTADDLKARVSAEHPDAAALIDRSRVAVDRDFAPSDMEIRIGAEVALIPPVSGG